MTYRNLYVEVHVSFICNTLEINLYWVSVTVKPVRLKFSDLKQEIFIALYSGYSMNFLKNATFDTGNNTDELGNNCAKSKESN